MEDKIKIVNCGCGGKPVVGHLETSDRWYIGCPDCDICTGLYNTEIEVVKAWNTAMGKKIAIVKDFGHPCGTYGYCSNCDGYCVNEEPYCSHCGAKVEWQ